MKRLFSRRTWLQASGAAAAGAAFAIGRGALAAPQATLRELKVISRQPKLYHGWPTVARCRSGKLLVSYSGGREGHVCPFGRVELIESLDNGQTWSDARVLMDTLIDDRDSGVIETSKGTLLVTTFTSLAYESVLAGAEKKVGKPGAWAEERLKRWRAANQRLTAAERRAQLGVWMLRSTDGGKTWSKPYDSLVNSPHGPIQLADGRIFYAGKDLWRSPHRVGFCQSSDDGQTWTWLASVPVRAGDNPNQYHELHAVEAKSGRLVAQIRNHNRANGGETLQTESSDGGKTWSETHPIGVWGLPSPLLCLADGRLLMTYGPRRTPLGNQARVSSDEDAPGRSPGPSRATSNSGDLGYPSTVQLANGSLLSVWYELLKGSSCAVLRQARWTLA